MAHADAMVGHGGSGSTLMAMAAGLPLAVVPLFADQPQNARRVAALGAGSRSATAPTPTTRRRWTPGWRRAGSRVCATRSRLSRTDPRYRDAAGAVAAEIAAQPPVDAVVEVLEDVVRGEALAA